MAENIGGNDTSPAHIALQFGRKDSQTTKVIKMFEAVAKHYEDVQKQWIQSDLWVKIMNEIFVSWFS